MFFRKRSFDGEKGAVWIWMEVEDHREKKEQEAYLCYPTYDVLHIFLIFAPPFFHSSLEKSEVTLLSSASARLSAGMI